MLPQNTQLRGGFTWASSSSRRKENTVPSPTVQQLRTFSITRKKKTQTKNHQRNREKIEEKETDKKVLDHKYGVATAQSRWATVETAQIKAQLHVGKATPPSPRHRRRWQGTRSSCCWTNIWKQIMSFGNTSSVSFTRKNNSYKYNLNAFLLPFYFLLLSVCRKRSETSWMGQKTCVQKMYSCSQRKSSPNLSRPRLTIG